MGRGSKHQRGIQSQLIEDAKSAGLAISEIEEAATTVEKGVWDSGFKTTELKLLVDSKLLAICRYIQTKLDDLEFSILVKGQFNSDGFLIGQDYYIPKQKVAGTSVDYEENIALKRNEGYNTVIHSHPFATDVGFSGADDEHINTHFFCSLLINKDSKPKEAVMNVPVNGHYLQLKIEEDDISEVSEIEKINDLELNRIEKKVEETKTYYCKDSYIKNTWDSDYYHKWNDNIDDDEAFKAHWRSLREKKLKGGEVPLLRGGLGYDSSD
jgi:hypothetical protein